MLRILKGRERVKEGEKKELICRSAFYPPCFPCLSYDNFAGFWNPFFHLVPLLLLLCPHPTHPTPLDRNLGLDSLSVLWLQYSSSRTWRHLSMTTHLWDHRMEAPRPFPSASLWDQPEEETLLPVPMWGKDWADYRMRISVRLRKPEGVGSAFPSPIQLHELVPSPGGSSQPRDRTRVSCTAGRFFTNWATREALDCTTLSLK